jgi:hypothetical protein
MSPPLACCAPLLLVVLFAGCGSSSGDDASKYPQVTSPPAEHQPPVTTPSGAVVTLPALPKVYEVEPSPTCERSEVIEQDGSRRPVAIPPAPGLRATALAKHTTRLEWWFDEVPDDCRPSEMLVSVVAGTSVNATPWTEHVDFTGATGNADLKYPEFLPVPDVARASAVLRDGRRSRVVSVLIRREANTPDDPPEPPPPVTAPAGKPVTCRSRATVVDEAAGDVLTYEPGSPPAQVRTMTPALSAIDITRAVVQIDGRTVCASFRFARAPAPQKFQLTFNLADTTEKYCCASLRFRRTPGHLELGHFSVDQNGVYELRPVALAGADLHGKTLTVSGRLPDARGWPGEARRFPRENLAWSVTTGYFPKKYGPSFGDWLPRHEPIDQPAIRHRDGAIIRPGQG